MKTQTTYDTDKQANGLAIRLNHWKKYNPVGVFRALNIPASQSDKDIIVTFASGNFWAGIDGGEHYKKLGPNEQYADKVIDEIIAKLTV